jgi:hypothetical protein
MTEGRGIRTQQGHETKKAQDPILASNKQTVGSRALSLSLSEDTVI